MRPGRFTTGAGTEGHVVEHMAALIIGRSARRPVSTPIVRATRNPRAHQPDADPTSADRSRRVTQRTLLRLGEISALRESGQLDRIITALQAHADDTWLNIAELDADVAPGFGAIAAVRAVFERFGLDEHFDQVRGYRTAARLADTVFVMVANRLLAPGVEASHGDRVGRRRVELPAAVSAPSFDQCYRVIDTVADATSVTEAHLIARLTSLMNLELRWCCYDLASTYFETTSVDPDGKFPSQRYG